MTFVFVSIIVIYLIFSIVLAIGAIRLPVSKKITSNFPTVSILISSRNEERDIERCIRSLEKLDYPTELLQVILVDDLSTDQTRSYLDRAAGRNTHFESYSTTEMPPTHLEAKARGIAYAASKAKGEWLFITDADCEVPKGWLKHMLYGVDDDTGVITAAMDTESSSFVGILEKIASLGRLLFGFGLAGYGVSSFALGPNMAIRHSVYKEAGGLEKADFRIAEDIALFTMSDKLGYTTKYHFDHFTTVNSTPVADLKQLHSQQARWILGGIEGERSDFTLTLIVALINILILTVVAGLIYMFMTDLNMALIFLLIKALSEIILGLTIAARTHAKKFKTYIPIALLYTMYLYIYLPLVTMFKRKAEWMGDGYEVKYD